LLSIQIWHLEISRFCFQARLEVRLIIEPANHATINVTIAPIRVYHGQKISVPIVLIQRPLVARKAGNTWIAVITASEMSIPTITGSARVFSLRHPTASIKPPTSAPLVRPRRENAAFRTNSTRRLQYAVTTSSMAQSTVEALLNRKKNASSRSRDSGFTKSIVDTEASEVSAELTEDIAADRIATIKNPFRT
jgi:hypothetical protein